MMGPLSDVTVVELAGIGPVPFAGMMLADMGATVVRVERVGGPPADYPPNPVLDRGRRSIAVDLKDPAGAALVLRLVARADALVEGFRPGVVEGLGIGPSDCLAVNPALVYGRMTGWGQDGPRAGQAGHDINYIGLTGALHAIGRAGEPPVPPLNLVGDYGGGAMFLAYGVVCALLAARRTGRGQVVDATVLDGTTVLMSLVHGLRELGMWTDERGHNVLDTGCPYYDVYECADGRYVAVGTIERKFFLSMVDGLGLGAEFADAHRDPSVWPRLRTAMREAFLTATRDEWAERFAGRDACVTPVLTLAEARCEPHAVARGVYTGSQPAPAPRFSVSGTAAPGPAPSIGEHTRDILRELGLPDTEVAGLLDRGVVG
jgi:alpha-methylacyl-CoA racemase